MAKFMNFSNGNKLNSINSQNEFFSNMLNLSNEYIHLRNAIGHNDYNFDPISQEIVYSATHDSEKIEKTQLLEVAISCVLQMNSAMKLLYISLLVDRKMVDEPHHPIPDYMYKGLKRNDRCACGSMKNYGQCCKKIIVGNKLL